MNPTRRDFLKLTTIGGAAAAVFGFDLKPAFAQLRTLKIARASETRSTCPYCAVGCGTIIYTIGDRAKNVTAQVVHVEGDPDHPTNRGTLCPKVSSLQQEIMNDRRLLKPLVRRPGGTEWQDISWDDAINEIAAQVKKTRDETFVEKDALGPTFGRGAMTNGWVDMKNTDMMLIMGGNPAENHPCGFKWPVEAKRTRNAKMIVVDPRFTRTASVADLFCQIRAGSDIAFLGGVIRYAIENSRIAKDYLVNYTNAAFIVKSDFKLPADTDGVFSGFDAKTQSYDKSTWNYAGTGGGGGSDATHAPSGSAPPAPRLPERVEFDLSLQNPNCVFQLLKKHYSRYTPEMVERITGIPREQFLKAADLFTSIRKDGDMKKAATIIYAVGWTQHTFGTQIIRTAAILQLLLGNVGRAGGGVNALRGHSNIQGATDMAGIFDNLPGYLKVPTPADTSFDSWMKRITPTPSKPGPWDSFNYYGNTPKFATSYLKALFGDAATKQNGWAFDYLPKVDRNYSWVQMWDDMYSGTVKGMLAFGMNGVAIGPDSKKNINALKKADWLVVGEIYPDETSEFWKSPGITQDEMKQIQTTVYRLPCAGFAEKDGSFTNSARWLLWKNT
ncbi:MAG: formate dehydrogenase, partial [Acidobacteria bacterium]